MTNAQKNDKTDLKTRARTLAIGLVLSAVITTMPKWCNHAPMQEKIITKEKIVYKCEPDSGVVALPPDAEVLKPDTEAPKPRRGAMRRPRPAKRIAAKTLSGIKCDPKLVTDSRANIFKRAGNAGIKSMASELASMSVSWEAYQCEPGKIEVNLEIQGNADSDTKRRLKSAIISKLEAKGFPLDMRIKSGMTDIVP